MKIKWRNVLIFSGLFLAVVLLIDFNRRMQELDSLVLRLNAVSAEGTSIMQTQVALVTKVAYATSDNAVEQWAYENKWVRTDEKPIGLVPAGGATSTPEPLSTARTENLPNWRTWWELFFGNYQ
jgi:hypothetical protein